MRIDIAGRQVQTTGPAWHVSFGYDRLIVATGAVPALPPIDGLDQLGPDDAVHTLGHYGAEVAKRVDILATAISYGATVADLPTLDLSYTPPLGSPFDAVQHAADAWTAAVRTGTTTVRAVLS